MQFANRLKNLGTDSAFEVLARAKAIEATGADVVHLEIGEPDFDTPQFIKDAAKKALDDGYTHYVPTPGITAVRDAFAEYITKTRGVKCVGEEIVIAPGAKPIIFFALMATINAGDEVIYPNPAYPIYESMIRFLGAKPVPVHLREQNDFRLDVKELGKLITRKTRMLILNSPQNPTGGVLELSDLKKIAALANKHDFWVMSDEVYSRILYDGFVHHSILSERGMKARTILIDGHSKTYAMTGWRLGYGVMPKQLVPHVARLQTNATSCAAAFTQIAGAAAYAGPQVEIEKMVAEFKARRDLIVDGLNALPQVTCRKPKGAFYVFPNFSAYGKTSKELETLFLEKAHVAALAGTSFGAFGEGYLRFSYANSRQNIEKAIDRIRQTLEQMPLPSRKKRSA
jgi:aspartate/methionine/tyrosine aminotransferase